MLAELHVRDLGIVDDVTVLLGPGLTAITGETGAGKTLLVEGLALLLGGRADASIVRHGASEARVEGRFLRGDGEEVVLARVVPTDGRSRAYIDGRLATAGELADVASELIELHGQHAHQRLLEPAAQRAALDAFIGDEAHQFLKELRAARADERDLARQLESLGGDARSRAREIDLLRFQVGEIEQTAIDDVDEESLLEAEESLLADATAHREALIHAYSVLEERALDAIGEAVTTLSARAPFGDLTDRLRTGQADLADLARELRLAYESVADDPERLTSVRARRQLLRDLCRKYGDTLVDVLEFAADAVRRLTDLEGFETRAREIEAERTASMVRAEAVTARLRELAMPAARLEVVVESIALGDDGADATTFHLAANPGEPARPLARAASGGELARAMLALRLVLSLAPPTVVFDEVDAGIGGEAGLAVGRLLAKLADERQVLCVTHLAQVAAFADSQMVVEKRETSGRTVALAQSVDGDARVTELSRMLAGVGESDHGRNHAAELLRCARADAPEASARSERTAASRVSRRAESEPDEEASIQPTREPGSKRPGARGARSGKR